MVDSKHQWKAWLYLAPAIILLLIFTVWPIFNTVRMAFTAYWDEDAVAGYDDKGQPICDENGEPLFGAWKGYSSTKTVGDNKIKESGDEEAIAGIMPYEFSLSNFKEVLNYDGFGLIMKNTVILCVLTVPLSTFLALIIAVCLNAIKPLQRLLQTIFFLPYVTNSIAIGMVFAAMFNIVGCKPADVASSTSVGIINSIIQFFGAEPINWINQGSSYAANIAVMVIYIVWNALPFKILILLGGLQSVNKQYYDAAKVDSTPKWRVFTRITVPLLSPMIAYVVITGFIGGFKEYTSIVGIFGEKMGPPGSTVGTGRLQTMVGYIYDQLGSGEGVASAAALILFALIFVVTLVNLAVGKKKTHY